MRLVLDWDGTVTETDTLWLALDRFGDPEVFARVEGALTRGAMSFREVMELEFSTVTAPVDEVAAYLCDEARVRPGLAELVREHDPLVLSSGFHELIEPVLAREGVAVELRANRLDPRPDGWRIVWRDPEPCPVCGDLCKRRSLPPGPVAYAGDGYSDRCAALAAARVFARDGLAAWLAGEGVPFERLDGLHELAAALARDAGGSVSPWRSSPSGSRSTSR
jgi:2-hydroxy-3-keto-5-methylthiopentenyl-1-phosphate phosphatase